MTEEVQITFQTETKEITIIFDPVANRISVFSNLGGEAFKPVKPTQALGKEIFSFIKLINNIKL